MPICTDTDKAHLARAIELARTGRGRGQAQPRGRRRRRARRARCSARVGTKSSARRTPRSTRSRRAAWRIWATRRCTSRSSRAATRARRRRAPTRSSRRGSGAWSSARTTRPRRRRAAASASCATRASRSCSPTASWRRSARLLNQAFRKHARVGRPWVLFKSAMTLDGKVATRIGRLAVDQRRGRAATLAHHWRASVDAVVVGIGTALADDPQLTARPEGEPAEPSHQPRRVVFDTLARLPPSSRLVAAAAEIPLTVVVSRAAARAETDALEAAGAQVLVATGENEPARVRSALDQLGALGVSSVLLEGGPHLAGAFLDAGEIDEIRLFLAPLLLGGSAARDPLEGDGRRAHLRGDARADVRMRARRRGPVDLGPPARVVSRDVHGPDRGPRQRALGRARRGRRAHEDRHARSRPS